MLTHAPRLQRFSPPMRGMSFLDLGENSVSPLRTRASSPSSVRSFPDECPKRSLASSIKQQDTLVSSPACSSSTRKVGFEPWVGVKNTITRSEFTEEEKGNYWLKDDDYVRIRRRNRMLIKGAETYHSLGQPLPASHLESYEDCDDDIEKTADGNFLCVRGLESGSKSESIRKRTCRRNSIQQVLIEQEFQCLQGCHDHEAIAEVYMEVTSPCKFRAVHIAMEDKIRVEEHKRAAH